MLVKSAFVAASACVLLLPVVGVAAPYETLPVNTIIEFDDESTCKITTNDGSLISCKPPGRGALPLQIFAGLEIVGKTEAPAYSTFRWRFGCVGGRIPYHLPRRVFFKDEGQKKLADMWPLKVGNTVKYEFWFDWDETGLRELYSYIDAKVTAKKSVPFMGRQTPVYVIEKEAINGNCGHRKFADHKEILWYAPEHRFVIHRETTHIGGFDDKKSMAWNVTAIRLPGQPAAVAQAPAAAAPVTATARPVQQQKIVSAADVTAPAITLPGEISVQSAMVRFQGRITDTSAIVEVLVDGRPISMAADGTVEIRRAVPVGQTALKITALDEWGNQASAVVQVTRSASAIAAVAPKPIVVAAPRPVVEKDTSPPQITLPGTLMAKTSKILIKGHVADKSKIAGVALNGTAIKLANDGSFSAETSVAVGKSEFELVALDEWGNRSSRKIVVQRASIFANVNFGRYHALVIGNNDYKNLTGLKTAINDARSVAAMLKDDYGFETQILTNASRSSVIKALSGYRAKLKADDNLLVYYAGHGILDEYAEEGYWLPVDAEKDNPANWISNGDITNMVRALRAKHVMVIADSCYSGTLVRAAEAKVKTANERETWIKRMIGKRSRTALVSGGLEPVLDGGGGDNSVFAKSFLDVLENNTDVLEAQALFAAVKRPVALESDQTPQYSDIRRAGHAGGDFLFVRRAKN